jgi:hypothetical protein
VHRSYNEAHLDHLERFVASINRDHDVPSPPGNRGLSHKLPKWMQPAGHRDERFRAIARLRQRLAYPLLSRGTRSSVVASR